MNQMIKKISIHQLQPGMFVHDMDCGWMEHPFLTGSFKVRVDKDIERMVEYGIHELYIDTDKGLDVPDAPTQREVAVVLTRQMTALFETRQPVEPTSLHDEMGRARVVLSEANRIIGEVMHGARLGRQIEQEKVDHVVSEMSESVLRNKDALLSLCRIKEKDNYTFLHSVSVGVLLMSFSRTFNLKNEDMQLLGTGGMLHDIGKTRVPDRILNKTGALTPDEFSTIQRHVVYGQNILAEMPNISQTSYEVVAQHHERYDGSGYPLKLKGADMSIYGQMASIVDVYDAITSDRCYRKGMDPTVALRKMFEWSKFHFDPVLIQTFVRTIGIYPVGTLVMLESRKIAVVIDQQGRDLTRPLVLVVFDALKHCHLTPQDVDLSKPLGHGGGDKIVSHESAEQWRIDPYQYI
ncbi:HD-GYP domain-containing protein [Rhodoferax sp.]|uniref:HD-GYP domain-containing protein n=1 Tax=Rhodoferax sp. TaxID=50421 RepID=UPI000AC598BA|nr:HD-GYP domain-containing protein [Rhodoferax sp.]MDO8317825.1 HD-GYP domain-containing protein [Rhodoferax sp.]MDP2680232.1 HD-GYP domain-containing protein [Rhodoferax sp.]